MACNEHLVFWPSCFSDVPPRPGCAQLNETSGLREVGGSGDWHGHRCHRHTLDEAGFVRACSYFNTHILQI